MSYIPEEIDTVGSMFSIKSGLRELLDEYVTKATTLLKGVINRLEEGSSQQITPKLKLIIDELGELKAKVSNKATSIPQVEASLTVINEQLHSLSLKLNTRVGVVNDRLVQVRHIVYLLIALTASALTAVHIYKRAKPKHKRR